MHNKLTFSDNSDFSCNRFHIRHNVRGEDDDPFAGELRQETSEANPLLGIEPSGRFIDDEKANSLIHQPMRAPWKLEI